MRLHRRHFCLVCPRLPELCSQCERGCLGERQMRIYHPHPALSPRYSRCAGQGEGTVESAARLKPSIEPPLSLSHRRPLTTTKKQPLSRFRSIGRHEWGERDRRIGRWMWAACACRPGCGAVSFSVTCWDGFDTQPNLHILDFAYVPDADRLLTVSAGDPLAIGGESNSVDRP